MTTYRPYTYLVRHKPTNTVYYGVRWKNVRLNRTPEQDLWVEYFTRSTRVHKLIEEYGEESFSVEIRRTFDSVDKAREWESKVLRRMKVLTKPEFWLNRTDNKAILNEIHPRGTLGKTWKVPYRPAPSKKGNTYTKGTKWINNGDDKRMIPKNDPIPEGYVAGFGPRGPRPDLAEYNRTKHPRLRTKA
jgi:Putative endonuclease segE, GIY-YIG domain